LKTVGHFTSLFEIHWGVFIFVYLAYFLYQWYLSGYENNQLDRITRLVASHVEKVLRVFDSNSAVVCHQNAKISILMHQKEVATVIEGCNAMSVMILFVSFVIAFAGRFRTTLFFYLEVVFLFTYST